MTTQTKDKPKQVNPKGPATAQYVSDRWIVATHWKNGGVDRDVYLDRQDAENAFNVHKNNLIGNPACQVESIRFIECAERTLDTWRR